jgi:hypothetical protein
MSEVRCTACGETGPNSYWLIDHWELRCQARWGQRPVRPAPNPFEHHHHPHTKYIYFAVGFHVPHHRKEVHLRMADLIVKDSDAPATAAVVLTDAQGNPTTPDQTPTWAEDSNGTVLTLTPSGDGLSCLLTWVAPGTANVTFSVTDNDGTKIVATGSVQVDPGEAVKATISFTPGPIPQPTPTPTP